LTDSKEKGKVIPLRREITALVDDEGKIQAYFSFNRPRKLGGRWVATFMDGMMYLASCKMTGEQWNVFAYLIGHLDFDNYLRVSRQEIAKYLGMQPVNVSRAMKKLKELDVIVEGPPAGKFKTYRLNPWIAHRGAKNIIETKEDWNRLKKEYDEKRELREARAILRCHEERTDEGEPT